MHHSLRYVNISTNSMHSVHTLNPVLWNLMLEKLWKLVKKFINTSLQQFLVSVDTVKLHMVSEYQKSCFYILIYIRPLVDNTTAFENGEKNIVQKALF